MKSEPVSDCRGAGIEIKIEKVYVPAYSEDFIEKAYCLKCYKECKPIQPSGEEE